MSLLLQLFFNLHTSRTSYTPTTRWTATARHLSHRV